MNLPNKLTIARIILVPIMVIIAMLNIPGKWIIVNLIFIIASITDYLDGEIARKKNMITTLGKFLDPLADKILVLSAMIIMVEQGFIPAWIPIIVIIREFIVSGYRLVAVEKGGTVISANIWGKVKTVTQIIAIIITFIDLHRFAEFITGNLTGINLITNILATSFMLIATIATILSGINYLKGSKELLKWMKSK